jgi:hypothetical protein
LGNGRKSYIGAGTGDKVSHLPFPSDFAQRYRMVIGSSDLVHPNGSALEARKVLELGKPEYNDMRMHQAFHQIARNRFVPRSVGTAPDPNL